MQTPQLAILGMLSALAVQTPLVAAEQDSSPGASPAPALDRGTFDVIAHGAIADGRAKDTEAIQRAIDAAAGSGGGSVNLPPGKYLSGTLFLKNGVTLHLDKGATLLGSTDLSDYPSVEPGFLSYTENYVRQALIYGENLRDIAVVGEGIIDGQGGHPVFKPGPPDSGYRRRPYLIHLVTCRGVRIEGITLQDSPMWVQHYLACEDVYIRGITVRSRCNANNDGIDINCCRNVRISDCAVSSGDDAIVLKSTADRPCDNVAITNCVLSSDCNGLKMGTETNGGFKNVAISNCSLYDVRLAGLTLQIVDGGTLDRVAVSNLTMSKVGSPIFLRLGNRARPFKRDMPRPGIGRLGNVVISNIVATGCSPIGSAVVGLPDHPIENVTLSNLRLTYAGGIVADKVSLEVPEKPDRYPEHNMFGDLPAYGLYCRHVRGLTVADVDVRWDKPDQRSAMVCDDVRDLNVSRLGMQAARGGRPSILLRNVDRALISGCLGPTEAEAFLALETGTDKVSLIGNDLSGTKRPAVFGRPELERSLLQSANRLRP
jgi:polygalacturonase